MEIKDEHHFKGCYGSLCLPVRTSVWTIFTVGFDLLTADVKRVEKFEPCCGVAGAKPLVPSEGFPRSCGIFEEGDTSIGCMYGLAEHSWSWMLSVENGRQIQEHV